MRTSVQVTAGDAIAEAERVFDLIESNRADVDATTRMEWAWAAKRHSDRAAALTSLLMGEAEQAKASQSATGTPLTTWLATRHRLSRREAAGVVGQGRALLAHQRTATAAVAGDVGAAQANAITRTLDGLAADLTPEQQSDAEQIMLNLANHLNPAELANSATQVMEQVTRDDTDADDKVERRLQREAEAAVRERSVRFFQSGASIRFDGSLPRFEAERWIAAIDTLSERQRRTALESRDPLAQVPTPQQRRADALIALIAMINHSVTGAASEAPRPGPASETSGRTHEGRARAAPPPAPAAVARPDHDLAGVGRQPQIGGLLRGEQTRPPRPSPTPAPRNSTRIVVALDYDKLLRGAAGAGVLNGHELSAGELRRLSCDAELLPVVLGGGSQVLDVGRAHRLVTPAIRAALTQRDNGCAFPGCDTPAARSEAHHIEPWWLGGTTSLANLVLLCHHHHGLVEPARHGLRDQWAVRIARDGAPEFIPPARIDPFQAPLRHSQHRAP